MSEWSKYKYVTKIRLTPKYTRYFYSNAEYKAYLNKKNAGSDIHINSGNANVKLNNFLSKFLSKSIDSLISEDNKTNLISIGRSFISSISKKNLTSFNMQRMPKLFSFKTLNKTTMNTEEIKSITNRIISNMSGKRIDSVNKTVGSSIGKKVKSSKKDTTTAHYNKEYTISDRKYERGVIIPKNGYVKDKSALKLKKKQ